MKWRKKEFSWQTISETESEIKQSICANQMQLTKTYESLSTTSCVINVSS
jgi:hypothetical protein